MITLKNFTTLNKSECEMVWQWRNDKRVSAFMKTKNIPFSNHCAFLESLKNDFTKLYFLVFMDLEPIGVMDFINIKANESCEFGIYQNPQLHGFGKVLMQEVCVYAKEILKIKRLYACAFSKNTKAIDLYLSFGFQMNKRNEEMCYFSLLLSDWGGG